jgi:membrane protein YqaA with SNARE-associated domain
MGHAFAALAGSVIGGLTTFAAAWVTQRQQANVQWFLQEKTRRQELYHRFIEEASKLYLDVLIHDEPAIPSLVSLYTSINKNEGCL